MQTEGGVVLPESLSLVKLPPTPDAPKGWLKVKSKDDLAVAYIRLKQGGCVDMVVAVPENVVVLDASGENKIKLKVGVVGLVGGEIYRGGVENTLEEILEQVAINS